MIRGIHGLFYSSDPDATRAFFKDAMQLPGSDVGEGWWIFDFPEGDLGVHPIDQGGEAGGHDISFYCDDIEGTVEDLKSRGVEFTKDVEDHGYGLVTYFTAPGGITVQLYEPRYVKSSSKKKAPPQKKAAAKAKPARAAKPAKKTTAKKKAKAAKVAKKKPAKKKAAKKGRR
jgi:catechol 2,3-dioxygenase-like lactoylglutathione lyase family enzyme